MTLLLILFVVMVLCVVLSIFESKHHSCDDITFRGLFALISLAFIVVVALSNWMSYERNASLSAFQKYGYAAHVAAIRQAMCGTVHSGEGPIPPHGVSG